MASKNEDDRTEPENSERDDDRDDAEGTSDEQSDEPQAEDAAASDSDDAAKEEPAAKTKPAAKPSGSGAAKSSGTAKKPAGPGAKRPVGAAGVKGARKPVPTARPRTSGSMVKTMILFLIILGGLGAAFFLLSPPDGGGGPAAAPKWNNGQVVDVEITLVSTDAKDLACASTEEIAGRKCEFETQTKARPKGEGDDADKKLLKPYTTTDRVQFLGAGLWSDPALKGKLPPARFSVKCKLTVEGKAKKPGIRWSTDWYEPGGDWFTGSLANCTLVP